MGKPESPRPVRLVVGIVANSSEVIEDAKSELETTFGRVDMRSETIPFTHTSYYASEMGSPLRRLWFSHENLVRPGDVAKLKLRTNQIEVALSAHGKRRVNLDPGYLSLAKLVLLTTKDAAHRIYLNEGIFAEISLSYTNHSWHPFHWTYPDYGEKIALEFFKEVRKRYMEQLRGEE